jgi:hypothetical protein
MRNCDVPGYPPSPMGPWYEEDTRPPYIAFANVCSTGGGGAFSLVGTPQMSPGDTALLTLVRPLEGPHRYIKLVKVSLWYAARLGGAGQRLNLYSLDIYSDNTTSFARVFESAPGGEDLSWEQQLSAANSRVYKFGLVCGLPIGPRLPDPCVPDSGTPLHVRGMEVTLSEDMPPSASMPSGTLLAEGPQSGVRTVAYAAADPESGVAKVEVLLDGTVVATDDLTKQCFYADFTVCPPSHNGSMQIDTRATANGTHALTMRVRDAAGNERVVDGGHPVEIRNEPMPGSIAPFSVVAKFSRTSRTTVTVPYGRRVVVRGRLTQGSQPVAAGVTLEILERLDRKGSHEQVASSVETKADGSFTAVTRTNRPSRVVRLAYRAADGHQVVSRALKVRVQAASRLRATLRGRVVRFSGRVLSGPIARRGKRVLMEGRSPGSAWTQFKSLRTDRHGRFSGTYRLRVRRPGVVLKVRAIVPSESNYGYVSARSRSVALRVR